MLGQTFDVPSQSFGHRVQFGRGYIAEVTLLQFAFHLGELEVELADPMLRVSKQTFAHLLEGDGPVILDIEPQLAAPEDQCAFGNAEVFGELLEGVALSAPGDEFLFCFWSMHMRRIVAQVLGGRFDPGKTSAKIGEVWRVVALSGVLWRNEKVRKKI
jgi:hypothetical protein